MRSNNTQGGNSCIARGASHLQRHGRADGAEEAVHGAAHRPVLPALVRRPRLLACLSVAGVLRQAGQVLREGEADSMYQIKYD